MELERWPPEHKGIDDLLAAGKTPEVLAGAAWLPVVWMQIRMRDLAITAAERSLPLPPIYWRYLRIWVALGIVYVVWGSTYLGIAIAIETMPPMLSGALRFLTAALLLGAFLLIRKGPGVFRMTRRQFAGADRIAVADVLFADRVPGAAQPIFYTDDERIVRPLLDRWGVAGTYTPIMLNPYEYPRNTFSITGITRRR